MARTFILLEGQHPENTILRFNFIYLSFANSYLGKILLFVHDKFYHQNDLNIAFIFYLSLFLKAQKNQKIFWNGINLDFET